MLETILLNIIAPLALMFGTWFFTRNKYKAEVVATETTNKGSELNNVEQAIKIWREMSEDLTKQNEGLRDQLIEIQKQNEELSKRLKELEEDNAKLLENYIELKKSLGK